MRCYLTRNGHIEAVEFLTPGPDDRFEVWDRARRLHVHPEAKGHHKARSALEDNESIRCSNRIKDVRQVARPDMRWEALSPARVIPTSCEVDAGLPRQHPPGGHRRHTPMLDAWPPSASSSNQIDRDTLVRLDRQCCLTTGGGRRHEQRRVRPHVDRSARDPAAPNHKANDDQAQDQHEAV
jgi:hypothetical protein